jgi:hypothetical protein
MPVYQSNTVQGISHMSTELLISSVFDNDDNNNNNNMFVLKRIKKSP